MIIVIDGPAGSGKSTTARAVAQKLDIEYIDSGALYRAVTLLFIDSAGDEAFFDRLEQQSVSFRYANDRFEVYIDTTNVTSKLRNAAVAEHVSAVAAMPRVRLFVNEVMRQTVKDGVYIAEGRDLGTAVFPDAALKFFMKADVDERAKRRYAELQKDNANITLEAVKKNILHRDKTDSKRERDPLKKAPDAIEFDTTDMTFDEQVRKICMIIKSNVNLKTK